MTQAEAEFKMQSSAATCVIFPWFQAQKISCDIYKSATERSVPPSPPPCAHILNCVVLVCKRHIFCQCQLGSSHSRVSSGGSIANEAARVTVPVATATRGMIVFISEAMHMVCRFEVVGVLTNRLSWRQFERQGTKK